ncbi:MAG: hypothetical protein IJ594_10325 [Oscillospiraceae bacterium]|nr:hypothetical protein [Oscillospiraceae bacterium]
MKTAKIYLCAGIFILLTALKLILPGQALLLRERVQRLLEKDGAYSQVVSVIGQRLSEERAVSSLIEAFRSDFYAFGADDDPPAEDGADGQA